MDNGKTYKTLITNNHALTEEYLLPGGIIKFLINNESKLFKIKIVYKRIRSSNKEDDVSIIEFEFDSFFLL